MVDTQLLKQLDALVPRRGRYLDYRPSGRRV